MALRERNLISTTTARRYLRVDDDAEDEIIATMIDAALDEIEGFLNHDFTHEDEAGEIVEDPVPPAVKVAALRALGSLYEWRDDETSQQKVGDETSYRGQYPVPHSAQKLLLSYRKPPGF